jgi:hypothetical protein
MLSMARESIPTLGDLRLESDQRTDKFDTNDW